MQNRLDGAVEARASSEKQLAELHSAIAAERVARPESVRALRVPFFFYRPPLGFILPFLGSARRGSGSACFREESVHRAARRTRGVRRL
jgi:hypothetical protein